MKEKEVTKLARAFSSSDLHRVAARSLRLTELLTLAIAQDSSASNASLAAQACDAFRDALRSMLHATDLTSFQSRIGKLSKSPAYSIRRIRKYVEKMREQLAVANKQHAERAATDANLALDSLRDAAQNLKLVSRPKPAQAVIPGTGPAVETPPATAAEAS